MSAMDKALIRRRTVLGDGGRSFSAPHRPSHLARKPCGCWFLWLEIELMHGLVQHDLAGCRDPRLGPATARSAGQKSGQIAARVHAAANQGVRLALRQTESRCCGQNQMAWPPLKLRQGTNYRSPPFSFEPVCVGDDRQVGHIRPRFGTHDCARTGVVATCFDQGLDRDGQPSLEGLLSTLTKMQPLPPTLTGIEVGFGKENCGISMAATEAHFEN